MHGELSVVVNRPIEEVWAFITDPFNIPRWGGGRLAARVTPAGPIRVGSTIEYRISIFGLERRFSAVFTEVDPPRVAAGSFVGQGFLSGSVRTTLEATATGTKIVRSGDLKVRGILRLLSPIVAAFMRRQVDTQMRSLKRLLEAGLG